MKNKANNNINLKTVNSFTQWIRWWAIFKLDIITVQEHVNNLNKGSSGTIIVWFWLKKKSKLYRLSLFKENQRYQTETRTVAYFHGCSANFPFFILFLIFSTSVCFSGRAWSGAADLWCSCVHHVRPEAVQKHKRAHGEQTRGARGTRLDQCR